MSTPRRRLPPAYRKATVDDAIKQPETAAFLKPKEQLILSRVSKRTSSCISHRDAARSIVKSHLPQEDGRMVAILPLAADVLPCPQDCDGAACTGCVMTIVQETKEPPNDMDMMHYEDASLFHVVEHVWVAVSDGATIVDGPVGIVMKWKSLSVRDGGEIVDGRAEEWIENEDGTDGVRRALVGGVRPPPGPVLHQVGNLGYELALCDAATGEIINSRDARYRTRGVASAWRDCATGSILTLERARERAKEFIDPDAHAYIYEDTFFRCSNDACGYDVQVYCCARCKKFASAKMHGHCHLKYCEFGSRSWATPCYNCDAGNCGEHVLRTLLVPECAGVEEHYARLPSQKSCLFCETCRPFPTCSNCGRTTCCCAFNM